MIRFQEPGHTRRLLVPATLVTGLVALTVFGVTLQAASDSADSVATASPDDDLASTPTLEVVSAPQLEQTTSTTTATSIEADDVTELSEPATVTEVAHRSNTLESATGYTLADAAQQGDPRIEDIECAYLSDDVGDQLAAVTEFRADRDRFFDIDSDVVRAARGDGLTFAEIAADFGFSRTDVQDGAAAMHGYCFVQMIGAGLTEQQAAARFQTTIERFLTLMDAEPDENGRGAGAVNR